MNQFAVQFGRLVVSYSFISIAALLYASIERLPKTIEIYARDIQIIVIYICRKTIYIPRNIETLRKRERER